MSKDESSSYRDKVDIRINFHNHLDRCLATAGTELFHDNVDALGKLLPTLSYNKLVSRQEEYISQYEDWVYVETFGVKMGTPEQPVYRNKTEDWNYDPSLNNGQPILVSPIKTPFEKTNDQQMFRVILEEAEDVGLLWSIEGGGVVNLPNSIAELLKTNKNMPRKPKVKKK